MYYSKGMWNNLAKDLEAELLSNNMLLTYLVIETKYCGRSGQGKHPVFLSGSGHVPTDVIQDPSRQGKSQFFVSLT